MTNQYDKYIATLSDACTVRNAWLLEFTDEIGFKRQKLIKQIGPWEHILGHLGITEWHKVRDALGRKVELVCEQNNEVRYINRLDPNGKPMFFPPPKGGLDPNVPVVFPDYQTEQLKAAKQADEKLSAPPPATLSDAIKVVFSLLSKDETEALITHLRRTG